MMLLHLIKKDILIAKRYVMFTLLIITVYPLVFMFTDFMGLGFYLFLYMIIIGELVVFQTISQIEFKYPKASALLCAAPYKRSVIVKAKYTLSLLLFVYCYAAYTLIMLAVNRTNVLSLPSVLVVLLIFVIIYGVYMPIDFKYGNVKARFIYITVFLLATAGPAIFTNLLADVDFSVFAEFIAAIPNVVMCTALALLSAVLFIISMIVSIRIFANKEL